VSKSSDIPVVDLNFQAADKLLEDFVLTEKQVAAASKRALKKTVKRLDTRFRKDATLALRLKSKDLSRRVKVRMARDGSGAVLWFGLNPISMVHLGPRVSGSGIKAGQHFRDKAFIAKMPSGAIGVYKRKSKARLPLVKQQVSIRRQAERIVRALAERQLEADYLKTLEQELNWEQIR